MHKLIQALSAQGWKVKEANDSNRLPSSILKRYPHIPGDIMEILAGLDECISADEKSWLLCPPDYHDNGRSAFSWNEFEKQSLQAATDDKEWQKEIEIFWDNHFPFYISVRNGYEYAAISLVDDEFGKVVSGREPEYEETTTIAETANDFLTRLVK